MWQRILSAEGLWTCPFVTETSMYLSAALQLAKQRHAPSTTFHNQKGKSYQKLTLHQFAYRPTTSYNCFGRPCCSSLGNRRQDSCRLQRLGFSNNCETLTWSYEILFHPTSSYFQDVSQCFTIFFVGHSCFDAGFVECETERFRLPRCCGFLSRHVKTRDHISERWGIDCIISLLLLLHHYVLKHDLNIFKHCVDNHIP